MSRSYRKTPIMGMTASNSEKEFKKQEHSKERARVRHYLYHNWDLCSFETKRIGNPWAGPKDGRQYFGHMAYTPCPNTWKYGSNTWTCESNPRNKTWHLSCIIEYQKLMRK